MFLKLNRVYRQFLHDEDIPHRFGIALQSKQCKFIWSYQQFHFSVIWIILFARENFVFMHQYDRAIVLVECNVSGTTQCQKIFKPLLLLMRCATLYFRVSFTARFFVEMLMNQKAKFWIICAVNGVLNRIVQASRSHGPSCFIRVHAMKRTSIEFAVVLFSLPKRFNKSLYSCKNDFIFD